MAKTVADVLNMVKENEVKFVDLRFTDTRGKEQHVTVPVSHFDEDKFTSGHAFDGSSVAGWKGIEASDMQLMPDRATANIDPFFEETTLFLQCDVIEPGRAEMVRETIGMGSKLPGQPRLADVRRRRRPCRARVDRGVPTELGRAPLGPAVEAVLKKRRPSGTVDEAIEHVLIGPVLRPHAVVEVGEGVEIFERLEPRGLSKRRRVKARHTTHDSRVGQVIEAGMDGCLGRDELITHGAISRHRARVEVAAEHIVDVVGKHGRHPPHHALREWRRDHDRETDKSRFPPSAQHLPPRP